MSDGNSSDKTPPPSSPNKLLNFRLKKKTLHLSCGFRVQACGLHFNHIAPLLVVAVVVVWKQQQWLVVRIQTHDDDDTHSPLLPLLLLVLSSTTMMMNARVPTTTTMVETILPLHH